MRHSHDLAKQASVPHKVMLRLDRQLTERGLRSYRGYESHGRFGAKLNFDDQTIEIGFLGNLRRVHSA